MSKPSSSKKKIKVTESPKNRNPKAMSSKEVVGLSSFGPANPPDAPSPSNKDRKVKSEISVTSSSSSSHSVQSSDYQPKTSHALKQMDLIPDKKVEKVVEKKKSALPAITEMESVYENTSHVGDPKGVTIPPSRHISSGHSPINV